jgi:hypothetical protein
MSKRMAFEGMLIIDVVLEQTTVLGRVPVVPVKFAVTVH